MAKIPLVVVGASAGGLDALGHVLREISPMLPAAILAVIHIGRFDANFPRYFQNRSKLPTAYARDGETITAGRVYLAPPDHHLLAADGHLHLGHGPRENHTRPAVDPLFRSAAEAYGPLAIGVVLSGNLTDGTAGLWEIKRRGGIAIVQDPAEAEAPGMPLSARQHVEVDYCLKLKDIGRTLYRLASEAATRASRLIMHEGASAMMTEEAPFALTCPDCGGAVRKEVKGTYTQFRCHTGHTFGYPELAEVQLELIRGSLESAARLTKERGFLCQDAANEARASRRSDEVAIWERAAAEAETREKELAKLRAISWKQPELASETQRAEPQARNK